MCTQKPSFSALSVSAWIPPQWTLQSYLCLQCPSLNTSRSESHTQSLYSRQFTSSQREGNLKITPDSCSKQTWEVTGKEWKNKELLCHSSYLAVTSAHFI